MNEKFIKSIYDDKKRSVSFLEKVVLYDEFEKCIKDGIYPLVLLLNKKETIKSNYKDYFYTSFTPEKSEPGVNYLRIYPYLIYFKFSENKIFLDKYYKPDGTTLIISGLYHGNYFKSAENPDQDNLTEYRKFHDSNTGICLVSKKGLFNNGKINEKLLDLEMSAYQTYISNPNRPKVKTLN